MHRPEDEHERGQPGRRMDPDPPGHRYSHDERHGVRDGDGRAVRCRVRPHALRGLRREPDAGRGRGAGELSRLPAREIRRAAQDAGMGGADHKRATADDRADRTGIRHAQAGGAVPRLRHAAARLWRAGGAGGLRAGGADRQPGAAGKLGERAGIAGDGRRAVLAGLPGRRKPGERQHPGVPVERGGAARQEPDPGGRRAGGGEAGERHQADLRGGEQRAGEPARGYQPDGSACCKTNRKWSSWRCRTSS